MNQEPDFTASKRPRFDPTINLGHVLTAVMMAAALLTMWTNTKVTQAEQDSRIRVLERSQVKTDETLSKFGDSVITIARTQDRLSLTLDYISKNQKTP